MHNINEHRQLCLRSYSYSFLKGNVVISVEQNTMRRFIVNKNTNLRNWRSLGYFLPSQKSNWLSTQWGRRSRRHKLTCPDRSRVVDPLHKNCIWILIWNLWRWRSGYLYPCCDSYFALWRRFQWVSSTDSSLVNSASTYTLPFRGAFLSYLSFGFASNLHFLVPMLLGYASMLLFRSHCGILTFILGFGYLIGWYVFNLTHRFWKS